MKNSKLILILTLCFIFTKVSTAKTWKTIHYGYWDTDTVWLGGIVPPYDNSDTIIIRNAIIFTSDINLKSGAYLQIDSSGGGLCGHKNIIVNTGAEVKKYGILDADTLSVPGGTVNCYRPGEVVLAYEGNISNGGSLSILCSFKVGPWFYCKFPEYEYAKGINTNSNPNIGFSVYPNPAANILFIKGDSQTDKNIPITILNSLGQIVFSGLINTNEIDISSLALGFYFIRAGKETVKFVKE